MNYWLEKYDHDAVLACVDEKIIKMAGVENDKAVVPGRRWGSLASLSTSMQYVDGEWRQLEQYPGCLVPPPNVWKGGKYV